MRTAKWQNIAGSKKFFNHVHTKKIRSFVAKRDLLSCLLSPSRYPKSWIYSKKQRATLFTWHLKKILLVVQKEGRKRKLIISSCRGEKASNLMTIGQLFVLYNVQQTRIERVHTFLTYTLFLICSSCCQKARNMKCFHCVIKSSHQYQIKSIQENVKSKH